MIGLVAGESGSNQPTIYDDFQKRHAVGLVQRAEQIVHKAGDEHRLARTAQTGNCEIDG